MNESAPKWEHHDDLSSLSYRCWIRPTTHEIKVLHIQNLAKAHEEAERVVHGHWDRFLSLCLCIDVAKKTQNEKTILIAVHFSVLFFLATKQQLEVLI